MFVATEVKVEFVLLEYRQEMVYDGGEVSRSVVQWEHRVVLDCGFPDDLRVGFPLLHCL